MQNRRLYLVFALVILLSATLSWRLFHIQVMRGGEWSAQAQGQQRFFEQTIGERGSVYLQNKNGVPIRVATNRIVTHAYISPREIKEEEKENLASILSDILETDKERLIERMGRDSLYEIIKRDLHEEEIEKVSSLSKVYLEKEIERYYPEHNLGSHLLGFVGGEGIGQYGIEQYYESVIGGREGVKEGQKTPRGFFITRDSTEKGSDLLLTIDYNIQHFVERSLESAHERLNFQSGSIIVGDPKTGKIIAMAGFPSFDPNNYSQEGNFRIFENPTVQRTFEPGSIFKPITMAMALNEGAISPEDIYYDTGEVKIHGHTIRNYARRSYGEVTMKEIMEKSINTGVVHIKDTIGNDLFSEYIERFEFLSPTGIDLYGEVYSRNESFLEGYDVNFANASFGQGIEITPIQFFRAFSALANGGNLVNPYIIQGMEKEQGPKVISSSTASQMTSILVGTVEDGFGNAAKVPGYHVAGKTGTSQITWSDLGISKRGYSDQTIQSFVGYAPAFNPEFLILVKLDRPQARTAEVSAAPIFSEVAEYILKYEQIPPDYNEKDE